MTNAEKFEEVFGFKPDATTCIAEDCNNCPVSCCNDDYCAFTVRHDWWDREYRGN